MNSRYFVGVFNETIIPLVLFGYEMIIANSALRASLATTISYPTRTTGNVENSIRHVDLFCCKELLNGRSGSRVNTNSE